MKRSIVFTGGGSAGHVTVNLALMPHFVREGWDVHYIGSEKGIERELVAGVPQVTYHSIATGKLRRYFDWNNVKDPFRVLKGVWQAYRLMANIQPRIVFSKGGFVSVPVVAGAWMNRIPTVIHESDLTPGLANKLAIPMATKVCTTFEETGKYLHAGKTVHVGAIVRKELFRGDARRGLAKCGFTSGKPVLLVMGGSLGSQRLNQAVRSQLPVLEQTFQIVHLCGKGNVEEGLSTRSYRQFEYVTDDLPDLLAMADIVVSRAGSNSIFEFLALRKPMLLIPLSLAASRGDQIANAENFRKQGYAEVLHEESLTADTFITSVMSLYEQRDNYIAAMDRGPKQDPQQTLIELLLSTAKD